MGLLLAGTGCLRARPASGLSRPADPAIGNTEAYQVTLRFHYVAQNGGKVRSGLSHVSATVVLTTSGVYWINSISRQLEKAEAHGGQICLPTSGKAKEQQLADAGLSTSTANRYEELSVYTAETEPIRCCTTFAAGQNKPIRVVSRSEIGSHPNPIGYGVAFLAPAHVAPVAAPSAGASPALGSVLLGAR
jgi:hypothetical protein